MSGAIPTLTCLKLSQFTKSIDTKTKSPQKGIPSVRH